MPNRIVRDGILRSEKIAAVSPLAELFFRRLMSVVDDFGRYYSKPALLLSDCFPIRPSWADEPALTLWIGECESAGLIRTYQANSTDYLEIHSFGQRIRENVVSKFPPFAEFRRESPLSAASCGEARNSAARATPTPPATSPTSTTPEKEKKDAISKNGNGATESDQSKAVSLHKPQFGPYFERVIGAFLAGGVKLSEPQILQAAQEWHSTVIEADFEAVALCAEDDARHNEARFLGLPAPWLRKRKWTARGPGRMLPDPPGRKELAHEIAARNFRKERAEKNGTT